MELSCQLYVPSLPASNTIGLPSHCEKSPPKLTTGLGLIFTVMLSTKIFAPLVIVKKYSVVSIGETEIEAVVSLVFHKYVYVLFSLALKIIELPVQIVVSLLTIPILGIVEF